MDVLASPELLIGLLQQHSFVVLVIGGVVGGIFAAVVGGGMFFSIPLFQLLFPGVSSGAIVGNIKAGSLVRGVGSMITTFRLIEFRKTLKITAIAFIGTLIGASIIADLDQRWLFFITIVAVIVAEAAPKIAKFVTPKRFTIASFLTGLYTGFLGAGSGILLVALLRLKHPVDADIGIVKANARFAETFLGISAVAIHFFHGNLIATLWVPWALGAFFGGILGGYILTYISALSGKTQKIILRVSFAVTIIVGAFAFF